MKKFFMLLALVTSAQVFAAPSIIEFDEAQELKCHQQVKAMNCTNHAGEEQLACVEANKAKLSATCKSMHTAKMNNK